MGRPGRSYTKVIIDRLLESSHPEAFQLALYMLEFRSVKLKINITAQLNRDLISIAHWEVRQSTPMGQERLSFYKARLQFDRNEQWQMYYDEWILREQAKRLLIMPPSPPPTPPPASTPPPPPPPAAAVARPARQSALWKPYEL